MGDYKTEIDFFDRGRRLRLIDEAQIPKRPKTSPGTLKHVLRVIESFEAMKGEDGKCWASVATIARLTCSSTSTVNVATKTLGELNLVVKSRRGKYDDRIAYTINWGELVMLNPAYRRARPDEQPTSTGQPPVEAADQNTIVNNQSTTVADQSTIVNNQTTTVVAPPEPPFDPQPQPPTEPAAAAWLVVGVELNKAGITKRVPDLIKQVRDSLGETPAEFLARLGAGLATIREPANRDKLEQPAGALFWWLWNVGGWPRGITMVDPVVAAKQREAKRLREAKCYYQAIIREVRQQVRSQRTWPEKRTRQQTSALMALDDRALVDGVLATRKVPRWYLVEVKLIEEVVSTPSREGARTQGETTR